MRTQIETQSTHIPARARSLLSLGKSRRTCPQAAKWRDPTLAHGLVITPSAKFRCKLVKPSLTRVSVCHRFGIARSYACPATIATKLWKVFSEIIRRIWRSIDGPRIFKNGHSLYPHPGRFSYKRFLPFIYRCFINFLSETNQFYAPAISHPLIRLATTSKNVI